MYACMYAYVCMHMYVYAFVIVCAVPFANLTEVMNMAVNLIREMQCYVLGFKFNSVSFSFSASSAPLTDSTTMSICWLMLWLDAKIRQLSKLKSIILHVFRLAQVTKPSSCVSDLSMPFVSLRWIYTHTAYLTDLCRPSLSARSTRHLRSAEQGLLHVPFARISTMQTGPSPWLALWYGIEA